MSTKIKVKLRADAFIENNFQNFFDLIIRHFACSSTRNIPVQYVILVY